MTAPRSTSDLRAGFIGLGAIGSRMARHVLAQTASLAVYDVRAEALAPFVEQGAQACDSAAEVARASEVIGVAVLDAAQVEEVVAGPAGILEGAEPGTVVCISSTVPTSTVVALAETARKRDVRIVDAGVAGGMPSAETATLVTSAGGAAEDVARARLLLDCFSKEVIHAGELGAGMQLKLVKNHVSYLALGIAHEGRRLAESVGISAAALAHVVEATDLLDQFFRLGLERDEFERLREAAGPAEHEYADKYTAMARKDLEAALALANEHGLELPFAETARAQAGRYFLQSRERDREGAD